MDFALNAFQIATPFRDRDKSDFAFTLIVVDVENGIVEMMEHLCWKFIFKLTL